MRPERKAFWVSVYWLRTDPPGGATAGKRPVATTGDRNLAVDTLNALTMYYGDRMTVG
jgi:hypothetical protein